MTTARKVLLAATAALIGIALTGCSVSFDEKEANKPGSSSSSSTSGSDSTDNQGSSGSNGGNGSSGGSNGTGGNGGSDSDEAAATTIPAPRPLPTIKEGDKPTYTDTTVTSSLATIIENSSVLATSKGWHATINGKVVGATSKTSGNNTGYAIASYNVFPTGQESKLPSGFSPANLLFVTTSDQHNAFASLLGILTPEGGTLTTFDAKQNPLSDALFAAAAAPLSKGDAKPTLVKYGTSKSFGKYGATPNAFSVILNPSTAGAFKEVTLWVENVGGKDVIVGVNDVRVGYGAHPSVEAGIKEYAAAIKSSDAVNSPMALGRISRFWVDMTTWWLSR